MSRRIPQFRVHVLLAAIAAFASICTPAISQTVEDPDAIVTTEQPHPPTPEPAFSTNEQTSVARPDMVDIEFSRKGSLRVVLKETTLAFDSPYGELKIPASEILSIDFATRLSDTEAAAIATAIASLASSEFAVREAATTRLLDLEHRAYPALVRAAQDTDAEVAKRAAALVARLETTVPPEQLKVRDYDVIETPHSKISGKLRATALSVETTEFGPQQLRLADIRSLRSDRARPAGLSYLAPQPDPGSMAAYQNQIGKTFAFTVTGRANGSVYGTGVYTADSYLSIAAVHTGVLKAGETAVIHVQMVQAPASFTASTQNGVTSNAWSNYPAGYRILGKGPATP